MRIKNLVLFASFTILFTTCKKNDDPDAPKNNIQKDVYAVGMEEAVDRKSVATLWKNGIATRLTDNLNSSSSASSIHISGTDVYILGSQENTTRNERDTKIWKNGREIFSSEEPGISTQSIFVNGSDFYVSGKVTIKGNYVATIWKNGKPIYLTDGTNHADAFSVFVAGNDVYVAGYEYVGFYKIAKVWKNGVPSNLTKPPYYGEATTVLVQGQDVYVAGYENTNGRPVAKVWKNGIGTSLSDGTNTAQATSVFVNGSDVYVAGYEQQGFHYAAKFWKNGTGTFLTDGTQSARASSIFVSGSDIYIGGREAVSGDNPRGKIWKNDGQTTTVSKSTYSAIYSIFVK